MMNRFQLLLSNSTCAPLQQGVVIDMPVDYTVQLENVMDFDHGGAVQVDPRLTPGCPCLISTVETINMRTAFKLCSQLRPAPLHHGVFAHQSLGFDVWSGSSEHPQAGLCKLTPGLSQLTPRLLSGAFRHFQGLPALETEIR